MAGFFQVPEAFAALDKHIIPALFDQRSASDPVRVWVAGCSSGEEAYSVAILLFEYASRLPTPPAVKVFASDNDQEALAFAQRGRYPASISWQMSPLALERYFIAEEGGYTVLPALREAVTFSTHEVLIDNAFQTLDLITCRHLLALLEKESQKQIISFFHHALRHRGFLFLGGKEYAAALPRTYEMIDESYQIYRLKATGAYTRSEYFDNVLDEETVFQPELALQPESFSAVSAGTGYAVDPPVFEPESELHLEAENVPDAVIADWPDPNDLFARPNAPTSSFDPEQPAPPPSDRSDPFTPISESDGMPGAQQPLQAVRGIEPAPSEPTDHTSAQAGDDASAGIGLAPKALVRFHEEQLIKHFMPASVLVDEHYNILHVTGPVDELFRIKQFHLERDILERLPAVYRRRVGKAIQQAFLERDAKKVETVVLPLNEQGHVPMRIQYLTDAELRLEMVHLVFGGQTLDRTRPTEREAEAAAETTVIAPGVEDALGRLILAGPFPMLLHAEGGIIVEMNKAWVDLTAYPVGDTTTLAAWTRLVRGHRIQLKDPKAAERYTRRGVECISIRTKAGDTRILALHSVSMGRDRLNRRLTLTMALDISGHSGQYGIGLVSHGADDTTRAKSAFLANVSHEIRTPLTSMIGFAEHLSGKLSGQDMQFARYISDSGYRLLETLNAILRAASFAGDEQPGDLSVELIDITLECQGLLQLFKPQADQYDLPLKMVIKEPVKAYLDRAAFRRILGNIIGNALKFTRRGEVTITVSTEGESVRVEVDDTGIGISEAFLPFVFDRFTQETKGEGRSYAGCGLGLSVAKYLAERMGGTIAVESQLGVGSKFSVRLPIGSPDSGRAVFGENSARAGAVKRRLLVVEDDLDTQELLLLMLRDRFDVSITSNATEALQRAQQDDYAGILMDLNLGGSRSGFELLADIRRLEGYPSIPVLAVSALPIDVIRKQLIKSGFNGYIAKPFTRARIFDALDSVLGKEVDEPVSRG